MVVYEFEIKNGVIPYSLSTYSFMNRPTLILFVWRFLWWSNTFVRALYMLQANAFQRKTRFTKYLS